eukprot:XP_011680118.1 PREDICTED: cylicin-1-like [Strongylocentrotus purpuratus]
MGSSGSKYKKSSKKSSAKVTEEVNKQVNGKVEKKVNEQVTEEVNNQVNGKVDEKVNEHINNCEEIHDSDNEKTDTKALKKAQNKGGNRKMNKGNKCKQRQQTKHHGSTHSIPPPSPETQIKAPVDSSADSGHLPSTDSVAAQSINSSEGSHELENALTEQMRTLEREKHDLTADLSTLNVCPIASEDDNLSADDLDASSVDDLDSIVHQERVTFDTPASPSKLSHLNKNRAPKQKKRPPARYSMLLGQDEADAALASSSSPSSATPEAQAPQEKIKKKRGSKEKKPKKKGKYNKKTDAKLDDSVVEV